MIHNTMPLGKWLDEWFTVYKKPKIKNTSCDVIETSGVHPAVTQRLVGHNKSDTTMRIYTHVTYEHIKKEVEIIDLYGGDE